MLTGNRQTDRQKLYLGNESVEGSGEVGFHGDGSAGDELARRY